MTVFQVKELKTVTPSTGPMIKEENDGNVVKFDLVVYLLDGFHS